jgi:cell division GTPase FtsZ
VHLGLANFGGKKVRLCIVGIGGAGRDVIREFLENQDLSNEILSRITNAEYVTPGRVKGIWLESSSDPGNQSVFKDIDSGGDPGYYIPQSVIIIDKCKLQEDVINKYGYDLLTKGTVRDAQYLKAIFEIFDTDEDIQKEAKRHGLTSNPIFESAWNKIKLLTVLNKPEGPCDGILFVVSLGGGTGTGFINPIIDHIKAIQIRFPVFVLGILTQPGPEVGSGGITPEGQRYLSAISAIYDLLTNQPGADGIILMDNEILKMRAGFAEQEPIKNAFLAIDKSIYKAMKPMIIDRSYPNENVDGQGTQDYFKKGTNFPPLYIPLYYSQPRKKNPEMELVDNAFNKGKLFGCSPEKADKVIVYSRGLISRKMIENALRSKGVTADDIAIIRKMGEFDDEILILLRNPYGNDSKAHNREWTYEEPGTLETKFCKLINSSLDYIKNNEQNLFYRGEIQKGQKPEAILKPRAEQAVGEYFFGKGYPKREKTDGLVFELEKALNRLEAGKEPSKYKPFDPKRGEPLFQKELRIFSRVSGKGSLFNWNEVPGKDDEKLREFLIQEFKIDWVRAAKNEKEDNDRTIKISSEKNSLSLKLNDLQNEVNLQIDDGRTREYIAKSENQELNIYRKTEESSNITANKEELINIIDNRIRAMVIPGSIKEDK